jgi:hypothetical protein
VTAGAELSSAERRAVAHHWQLRSNSERRAADVLRLVATDLRELQAPAPIVDAALRSIEQEETHARICRDVATAYDASVTPGELETWPVIDAHPAGDSSWRWRHVVGFCCISETYASAYLSACWRQATAPIARKALHRLLADEVGHGQLGWAFLACPVAPSAQEMSAWLVPLLEAYEEYLHKRARSYPDVDIPAHGAPHPRMLVPQYRASLEELILPGFDRFGVQTAAARIWLRGRR